MRNDNWYGGLQGDVWMWGANFFDIVYEMGIYVLWYKNIDRVYVCILLATNIDIIYLRK